MLTAHKNSFFPNELRAHTYVTYDLLIMCQLYLTYHKPGYGMPQMNWTDFEMSDNR